jgi:multiple sugar transport system substrate-binding protein
MIMFQSSLPKSPSAPKCRFRALRPLLRPLLSAGAALALSGTISAAPPSPDTKADLVLFDFGDAKDKQIREAAIARFNKRYPNAKVVDQFNPITSWSDYLDKLLTLSVSGKAPDLIHIATEGAQLGVHKRLLRPLNDFVENDPAQRNRSPTLIPHSSKVLRSATSSICFPSPGTT